MIRSELVAALMQRRDNDVQADVPLESGGSVRVDIEVVSYDPITDVLILQTSTYFDLPEGAPNAA